MTDDLIERLNEFMGEYGDAKDECISQAVDALTAAQARIAELERALTEIAEAKPSFYYVVWPMSNDPNDMRPGSPYDRGVASAYAKLNGIAREALKTKGQEQ